MTQTPNPTSYTRPDLDALPDYTPAHVTDPRRIIKLDSNENVYGPSPRVVAAFAATDIWHFYAGQDELVLRLADYAGVAPDQIVVTNGGDESIDLVLRAVLEPGDVMVDAPPSFEMYRIDALANRANIVEVPRRDDFSLDLPTVLETVARTNSRVIALASPNNPDGGLLPRADLLQLLDTGTVIMLDEAYFEFSGETAVDLLPRYPNLALVRTFSKWAGLAGLRVGYVIGSPAFIRVLHKLRSPYNVNLAGIIAATESLNDVDYLLANVRATIAERERMRIAVQALGWLEPMPSHTNFLLMRVRDHSPQVVRDALAARGILIRVFRTPRLKDYLRISIGTPPMNDAVLAALEQIGAQA